MKTVKQKQEEFIASLMPDSDKKMMRIASASLIVALTLGFWATTYERIIDDVIFDTEPRPELGVSINIKPPPPPPPKEVKKNKPKAPSKSDQNLTKKPGGSGKQAGRGKPKSPQSMGLLRILESRTNDASHNAFVALGKNFRSDLDKLDRITGFKTSGKHEIGASRPGKVNAGFNEGYAAGGAGGIGGLFDGMLGGSKGRLAPSGLKGHISTPKPNQIEMGSGGGSRSASDIMKVVRQRTPGLRHIYNKHLKKNPGFQGKVTLRFTIAPGGEIVSIAIASSTTGYSAFDTEIKDAVGRWTFTRIKSGNTTVTIPFTFTE